jgi:hypothetical protein
MGMFHLSFSQNKTPKGLSGIAKLAKLVRGKTMKFK